MKEWRGAYSDGSREMTASLMKELRHTNEDDGQFWMTYEDWLGNFDSFAVCRLLTDEIGKVWEKRMFVDNFSGGCSNHPTWTRNSQFWIQVSNSAVETFIHLAQSDTRCMGSPQCKASIGFYLFGNVHDLSAKKTTRTANDALHTPTFINSREYALGIRLAPGNYIVMPCTFAAHDTERYFLTIYSEDPITAGKIGQGENIIIRIMPLFFFSLIDFLGAAPRMKVEMPDMKQLGWLNRSGAPPPPVPRRPHAPHIVTPSTHSSAVSPRSAPALPRPTTTAATSPRTMHHHSPSSSHHQSSPAHSQPHSTTTTTTSTTISPDGVKTTRTTKTTLQPPPPSHSHSSSSSSHSPRSASTVVTKSVMCKRCLRSIKSGESFVTRNGKTYCQKHAYEKCKGCKKDLTGGTVMTFGGKKFHPGCFKCSSCRASLGTSFYKNGKGKIVCQRCVSK
jgi:hypothetical protein